MKSFLKTASRAVAALFAVALVTMGGAARLLLQTV